MYKRQAQQVADLVAALKKDGHDFSVGIPMDTPIPQAERVVSAGKGIGCLLYTSFSAFRPHRTVQAL